MGKHLAIVDQCRNSTAAEKVSTSTRSLYKVLSLRTHRLFRPLQLPDSLSQDTGLRVAQDVAGAYAPEERRDKILERQPGRFFLGLDCWFMAH